MLGLAVGWVKTNLGVWVGWGGGCLWSCAVPERPNTWGCVSGDSLWALELGITALLLL